MTINITTKKVYENSLSLCLQKLREGDEGAAERLWLDCYPRLVMLARKRLQGVRKRMADGEDVALSALNSFFKAFRKGRFPDLRDRDDLWRLLFSITSRKAIDLRRYEARRPVSTESALDNSCNNNTGIHQLPAADSEEAVAVQIAEELEAQLGQLAPDLQELAIAKLQGYTNPEIAENFGIALRSVERRMQLIRRKWEENAVME